MVSEEVVAAGGRSGLSRWADHRSSNFGVWPVVSDTGAPVASGAGALASGKVTADGLSGVVLWGPEGPLDLSYCFWAGAVPTLMSSAELAKIANCFLMGIPPVIMIFRRKRPASLAGSSSTVAAQIGWVMPRTPHRTGENRDNFRTSDRAIVMLMFAIDAVGRSLGDRETVDRDMADT